MPSYKIRTSFESHETTSQALVVTVLNFDAAVLTDPPNYADMAADMASHFQTMYEALLTPAYTLDQIVVRVWEEPGVAPGEGSHAVNAPGTRTASDTGLSPAVCGLSSWHTATPKRYARGHTFWPPARSTGETTTGGNWHNTGAYWLAMVNFSTAYLAPWTAGSTTYSPVIFSYKRWKANTPPWSFPVTGWVVHPEQHWLRKRITVP